MQERLSPAALLENLTKYFLTAYADLPPVTCYSGEYPGFMEIHGKEGLVENYVTKWGRRVLKWILDQHFFTNIEGLSRRSRSVSYTHLRAHETDSYLVC